MMFFGFLNRCSMISSSMNSGFQVMPSHHDELQRHEGEAHGKQVFAEDAVMKIAVFEQDQRQCSADHALNAGGLAAMGHKTLVHELGQQTHHPSFSSVKMSSVAQANARAKASANCRLGT